MERFLDIQDCLGEPLVSLPQGFRFEHIFQSKEGLSYLLRPATRPERGIVMSARASSRRGPWDTIEWNGGSLRHALGSPLSRPLSFLGRVLKAILAPNYIERRDIYRDANSETIGAIDWDSTIRDYVLILASGLSCRFNFWCKAWPGEKCVMPVTSPVTLPPVIDERLITWPYDSGLAITKGIVVKRFVTETPMLLAAVWHMILNASDGG